MGTLVLTGATSGSATIQPTDAVTNTLTLPSYTGTIGSLNSGTAVASTSGTSIDFTGIPSGVRRITVMFNGVSTNGTSNIQIQVGAGSVTASGYVSNSVYNNTTSTSVQSSTAGFILGVASASSTAYGSVVLTLLGSNIWVAQGVVAMGGSVITAPAGGVTLSGTLDRVRITTVNGTDAFDAGSINILYE